MKALPILVFVLMGVSVSNQMSRADVVDATTLRGKILVGYQGWFRAPGDVQDAGWIHWSREGRKISPETVTFEMWPDMAEFPESEKYAATGFSHKDGSQAYLFSSDQAGTVQRHFEWMREHGLDGVWMQHFVVDLPGAPAQSRYESRSRVLHHVAKAAEKTGRTWALTFDMSGVKAELVYDIITREWRKLTEEGLLKSDRYLKEGGKPVVMLFGLYPNSAHNPMTPEVASRLLDFFHAEGPTQAFVGGAGDWQWRKNPDPDWARILRRFDALSPWNPANYYKDRNGVTHATTDYWKEDKAECDRHGILWLPTLYPGFSWDNLKRQAPGTTSIPRRGGKFFWEQFAALSKVGAEGAMVAMFDEVDEATAIFKVTNNPPVQGYFLTYEGMPADWYLRLTGEATRRFKQGQAIPENIPIVP